MSLNNQFRPKHILYFRINVLKHRKKKMPLHLNSSPSHHYLVKHDKQQLIRNKRYYLFSGILAIKMVNSYFIID